MRKGYEGGQIIPAKVIPAKAGIQSEDMDSRLRPTEVPGMRGKHSGMTPIKEESMKCPDCQNELYEIACNGININECVECKGRWFDRGELRAAKNREDDDLRWLDFDPFGDDAEQLSVPSDGKKCPKCSKQMSSLTYKSSKLVIDKCLKCEGVWLDHGEFEKIIKYLEDLIVKTSAAEYTKETFKQFVEIFTGQEGLVSEAKDFFAVMKLLQIRLGVEHPGLEEACQNIYRYTPFR